MKDTKKNILFVTYLLLFVLVVTGVGAFYYIKYLWNRPIDPKGTHVIIEIKEGDSFLDVINTLKDKSILKDTRLFYLMGRITGAEHKIKSGEFLINTRWSQKRLLEYLIQGRPYLHKITIPEGLTWWEVGKLLEKENILKFSQFKKIIFNRDFLRKNNIPGENAEGYLFPDTYFFEKGSSYRHAKEVVETMIDEFWKSVKKYVWKDKLPPPKKVYRVVILASLVEKEALYDFEKPIIAGVFINRLKKGMRLQCDPTVIYGMGPNFKGRLRKRDLKNRNNPYNTYVFNGLPKTPICSPSISSIYAVVHPAHHSYLYFVAKGDGTHKFSSTLEEHNRAVYKYQIAPQKK